MKERIRKITPMACAAALAFVRRYGRNVAGMATAAGVHPTAMRRLIAEDPDLADQIEEAEASYLAHLLDAAHKRAIEGFTGPQGEKKYSDVLLVRLLQGADRKRFGNSTSVEVSGKVEHEHRLKLGELTPKQLEILEQLADELPENAGRIAAPEPEAKDAEFEVEEGEDADE